MISVIAITFGVSENNKKKQIEALAEAIQGNWYIHEDTTKSVLFFDETKVEYGYDTSFFGYFKLLDGNYEVISGNQIQSDLYQAVLTYTVEFNEDKTEMYITPSPRGYGEITETWTTK